MANDISGRPWVLDTATVAPAVVKHGQVYVKGVVFSEYAAQTDNAVITFIDATGATKDLCKLVGRTDLGPVYFALASPIWVRELGIPTLTSGKVSVFV